MSNPPKPTRLKLLAGTARKDRISPCEPDPGELDLTPPAELSPAAVEHWHRFATMLARSGVAKASDRELLAMLAEGYARHCANVQAGKLDLGLMKELRLMLGQFGMSPATRSRIVADKPQGDGKASRYFGTT